MNNLYVHASTFLFKATLMANNFNIFNKAYSFLSKTYASEKNEITIQGMRKNKK